MIEIERMFNDVFGPERRVFGVFQDIIDMSLIFVTETGFCHYMTKLLSVTERLLL